MRAAYIASHGVINEGDFAELVQALTFLIDIIADTGAEAHTLPGQYLVKLLNRRMLNPPVVLESANGECAVEVAGEIVINGLLLRSKLISPASQGSLLPVIRMSDDGWNYTQGATHAEFRLRMMRIPWVREEVSLSSTSSPGSPALLRGVQISVTSSVMCRVVTDGRARIASIGTVLTGGRSVMPAAESLGTSMWRCWCVARTGVGFA